MKDNFNRSRHTPRKRSILYCRALMIDRRRSGLLDHPRARVMTMFMEKRSAKFSAPPSWIRNLESSEQQQDQEDHDDKAEAAAAIISGAVERPAANTAKAAEQGDNKNNENDCSYGHVAISSSPAVGNFCSAFGLENKWQIERFRCSRSSAVLPWR